MPLMPKKSKSSEMEDPKGLAIAYEMKRRNKRKKMAEGGDVKNESAKMESRPMPEERDKDAHSVSRNSGKKSPGEDSWTDQPTVAQAQKSRITPLSRPRFVNGSFTVRDRADVEKEEHLMSAAQPNNGPQHQPDSEYDEDGPDRSGPMTPSLKMKRMAKGGMINEEVSMHDAEMDADEHPAGLEEDDDQMRPPMDEYMSNRMANGGDVDDSNKKQAPQQPAPKKQGIIDSIKNAFSSDEPEAKDFPSVHQIAGKYYADGGEVEDEHHASIAAAIMAKRDRMMMAEGGEVDLDENAMEQPNGYYARNEDAALKENYDDQLSDLDQPMDSNEHDVSIDSDEHDMISRIRSKMKRGMIKGLP